MVLNPLYRHADHYVPGLRRQPTPTRCLCGLQAGAEGYYRPIQVWADGQYLAYSPGLSRWQWEVTGLSARPNYGQLLLETSCETEGVGQRALAPASPTTPGPGLAVPLPCLSSQTADHRSTRPSYPASLELSILAQMRSVSTGSSRGLVELTCSARLSQGAPVSVARPSMARPAWRAK